MRRQRRILVILIYSLLTVFPTISLDVSPANPNPGDTITITGSASPNDAVSLRSSFGMNLPVSSGQYEYATSVIVPQTPNRITVTAKNVKDFNAGVKLGIWVTKSFEPSRGTVRLSQADVPAGSYNLKMFGAALPGSTAVPVSVEAETEVKADSQGKYVLDIDTTGIPAGEYRIEAGGAVKTIQIGKPSASSFSGGLAKESEAETLQVNAPAKPVEITPNVVRWYANKTGLEIKSSSQLGAAEKVLLKRLDDGIWKVIARGEPLTEEAGNCMQEYCLVRGAGACTACREKDIILKGSQPMAPGIKSSENHTQTQANGKKTGLWSTIAGWLGFNIGMGILAGAVSNN